MSEHTHPAYDDMDATRVSSERQTLEAFIPQLRRYEWAILNTQDMLKSLRNSFSSGQRIWPVVCNEAIKNVGKHIHRFHTHIEPSINLPLVVVSLRLPILLTLKNSELQITKLTKLLTELSESGKTALSQPAEGRQVIVRELDILIEYSEEVVQLAEDLLRRAKEREYSTVWI
jgi:hypothetical protein